MSENSNQILADKAKEVRKFAQAKYSNFPVGAALITDSNEVFTGCNVESSSYSMTICAERVALTKALSEGKTKFRAIAIAAKDGMYCSPCGACRQLLYDYAPNIDIILTDGKNIKTYTLQELLPLAFEESQLG